jgi:superfamily II DNA or RNA helicase
MALVPTVIDSHLRVDGNYIGHALAEEIFDELTVVRKDRNGGRQELLLADMDGDTIIMPRGYAMEYKLLLRKHGHRVWWMDRRTWEPGKRFGVDEFSYRNHQPAAVKAIKHHQFGVYEAPTGSGKTVTCCGFLWDTPPEQGIILVDKKELLYQWQKKLVEHTGCRPEDVGQIGDGKWREARFTVATVQTLWRALKEGKLSLAWFKKWSVMILDECHHVTADTLMDLVSRFWARYRFGTSATPDSEDDLWEIVLNILGDVMYADAEEELRDAGVIMVPTVYRIDTPFKFAYWGDHKSSRDGDCEVPGCKKETQHSHRNNYQALKSKLVRDPVRNGIVMSCVLSQVATGPHAHLIISNEVEHLKAMMATLERMMKLVSPTGCSTYPPAHRPDGARQAHQAR